MTYPVITIGREFGSGGRLVGRRLAQELGIPFYDKELIAMAAEETGFSEEFIRENEQKRTSGFLANLYFNAPQNLPMSDQVFIAQSNIIKKVAKEGSCIIVGRCADYVLAEQPHCLHVFIHAPLEERIRRVKEFYGLDLEDVRSYILRQDKDRASYYNYFASGEWGRCQNYDLSINSGLGLDTVVHVIRELAEKQKTAD
ncbi:MAG: cytidylate kinase-like family protein [Peptococcaceae bacterium]|nr:cytidylate kinase-like family protein [Peptococcaceae bacterium]